MATKHYLPSKVSSYLKRLDIEYATTDALLHEIVTNAHVAVIEETTSDNWNGGTYEHDIIIFLPPPTMKKVAFKKQQEISDRLLKDLNKCATSVDNESFRVVAIELADESDPVFQKAVPFTEHVQINPDTLSIWLPDHIRLFISHRDTKKAEAKRLAIALEAFGISAFVAHDTIEPMSRWQLEIVKGLETMEVMLAFVTDDFQESIWTNQEIGYALGKNIPIISLKLESHDPSGFIGEKQALKGRLENPEDSAPEIYKLLAEKLGQKARMQRTLISAFVVSPDWNQTKSRFQILDSTISSLSSDEFSLICQGYSSNGQLHQSIYLNNHYNRLQKFLERCTGKKIAISDKSITLKKLVLNDDIPF